MKSLDAKLRSELNAMLSICNTLKDLKSNAAKGRMLVDTLQDFPILEHYFRYAFDHTVTDGYVILTIRKALASPAIYGKEAVFAARRVNKGDLKCGLTAFVVNKAFEKCGLHPLAGQEKMPGPLKANDEGISFILHEAEPPIVNGTICFNGERIGTLQFDLCGKVQTALAELRKLGILTFMPVYVERGIKNANRAR